MFTFTTKSALIWSAIVSLVHIPAFGQVTETEVQKLIPIDLVSGDWFGVSVALDGDTALIGAPYHDDGGTYNNGAAYVFTRSAGVWTEQAKLLASDKEDWEGFGRSVAIDGDTAVIGAYGEDDSGTMNNGAAYVFTHSGGVWTEQAKLLASDKSNSVFFGNSVALDGDTAVIGTYIELDDGKAYVFTRSGGIWTEQAKLMASDNDEDNFFGSSVALDGDTALIGAPNAGDNGTADVGSAYIFTRSGDVWAEQAKLLASDKDTNDWFGSSVALDGDTALIGADLDDDGGTINNGAVYVFTRSGGVWTEQAKLLASDKEDRDGFGVSVALDGDAAVIGATGHDDGGTSSNGAAYMYTRSAGVWTEQAKLLASDKEDGDRFGVSVALDGATAIIGTFEKNDRSGAAYVFAPNGITSVEIDVKPESHNNPINLRAKNATILVGILTTNTFDALQVDWETVRFGPSKATERHERLHVGDTDGDGDMDAKLHFRVQDTGISCGDTEATLTGETYAGEAFTGSDTIKIVKCPKQK